MQHSRVLQLELILARQVVVIAAHQVGFRSNIATDVATRRLGRVVEQPTQYVSTAMCLGRRKVNNAGRVDGGMAKSYVAMRVVGAVPTRCTRRTAEGVSGEGYQLQQQAGNIL